MAPSNPKTALADAQFKKAQREADGRKAAADYEAEGIATRAKTEKLRALRLARDAEIAAAAPPAPAAGKRRSKTAKSKRPSLSDYQRDLDSSGRNR